MNLRFAMRPIVKIAASLGKASPVHFWSLVVVLFILLGTLSWQRQQLYTRIGIEPVGMTASYHAEDLDAIKSNPDFRLGFYNWTQIVFDSLLPLAAVAVFLMFVGRWSSRALLRIAAVFVSAGLLIFDWTENAALLAYFNLEGPPAWLADFASLMTWFKLLTLLAGVVVTAVVLLQRYTEQFQLFVVVRYPVLALAFLVSWSFIATLVPGLNSLGGNLVLLDDQYQVGFLAMANFLAITFDFAIWRLLIQRHLAQQEKVSPTHPWSVRDLLWVSFWAAFTPGCCFVISHRNSWRYLNETDWMDIFAFIPACLTGFSVALGLLFLFGMITRTMFGDSSINNGNIFPFQENEAAQAKAISQLHKRGRTIGAADFQLGLYFFLLIYVFFIIMRPDSESISGQFLSIPVCVVILSWLLMMIMSALSFWLRRSRIPVFVVLVLWVVMVRGLTLHQAVLPVVERTGSLSEPAAIYATADSNAVQDEKQVADVNAQAWQAVQERIRRLNRIDPGVENDRTLVVVTCPGGGIHAATWAAFVLEKLHARYEKFSDSIVLLSGVSGGSHGAIVYVNGLRKELDHRIRLDSSLNWRTAASSSLWPLGTGLAFDDVPAMLVPGTFELDRGERLDAAWKSRMGYVPELQKDAEGLPALASLNAEQAKQLQSDADAQTLNGWGSRAANGELPVVVLNATDSATGRRILFSTVPSPRRTSLEGRFGRPWDIRELFDVQRYDMHMATAARASATFPYATPFARPEHPSPLGEQVAIGDGGYVDNEGIVTAVDWIDFLWQRALDDRQRESRSLPFQRIVLLRIQPSSDVDPGLESPGVVRRTMDSMRWLIGPLETLMAMRRTSQLERGQLEADLAANLFSLNKREEQSFAAGSAGDFATNLKESKKGLAQAKKFATTVRSMQQASAKQMIEPGIPDNLTATPRRRSSRPSPSRRTELDDRGVIECRLPFIAAPGNVVPLSWKLSEKEKLGYEFAWIRLEEKEDVFFKVLDAYFVRRPVSQN